MLPHEDYFLLFKITLLQSTALVRRGMRSVSSHVRKTLSTSKAHVADDRLGVYKRETGHRESKKSNLQLTSELISFTLQIVLNHQLEMLFFFFIMGIATVVILGSIQI